MTKSSTPKDSKIQTSFMLVDDSIIEQCYDIKKGCYFAIYKDGEVEYKKEINVNGITYVPIIAEEVQKKAILLPDKAEDYGTDEELDSEIKIYIRKWLDIPEDVLQFSLWNIKRSWVFDRFHTLNYLRALGDTGMGKTRFLDVLGQIHYKPIATSGATTAAPVFRIIEKWRPTLIMDEADFAKSDEAQDIIKIINLGYEKGKHVMRCDQNDAKTINLFDPYCPKILATRGSFEDKATESRCITQVMKGTNRQDVPLNLNKDFFDTTQTLRNKLLMWRFKNYHKIEPDNVINLGLDLEPRVKQIVNSFISLFGKDKKQLEDFKVFIQNHQADIIEERKNSWDGVIVGAIYELMELGYTNISAQDIIDHARLKNKKGNPVQPRSLSSTLKSLGFGKTITKRIGEITKRCVPLETEVIENIFRRYGYGVTVVTVARGSSETQKELKVGILGAPNSLRNNRNTVTEKIDSPQEMRSGPFVSSGTIKNTLFSLFAMQPEIEIQQFLTRFPKEFHAAIDIMLNNLKSEGEIFECKPGWIKML